MSVQAQAAQLQLRRSFLFGMFLVCSATAVLLSWSQLRLFPMLLTPFLAAAALYVNDDRRWFRLPVLVANLLGLAALLQLLNQFDGTNLMRLERGTDLLVQLSWIVLFMPVTARRYWWLLGLAALQTAASAVLIADAGFGGSLIFIALLMQWTLCLFTLQRAVGRNQAVRQAIQAEQMTGRADRSRRLRFWLRFLGLGGQAPAAKLAGTQAAAEMILVRHGLDTGGGRAVDISLGRLMGTFWFTSLLVAAVAFAVFPRMWMNTDELFAMTPGEMLGIGVARSGLSEAVRLGHHGRLLLSNEKALSLSIREVGSGREIPEEQYLSARQEDEIYLRGNVYSHYADGEWSLAKRATRQSVAVLRREPLRGANFELRIELEATAAGIPVCPFPAFGVAVDRGPQMQLESQTQVLRWQEDAQADTAAGSRTYRVQTEAEAYRWPPGWQHSILDPRDGAVRRWEVEYRLASQMLETWITPDIPVNHPRVNELAGNLMRNAGRRLTALQKVQLVLDHLSAEQGFEYSLDQPRIDLDNDPLTSFLFSGRKGHCDYFASGCVLLLQAMRVPARLVTGYTGCEADESGNGYVMYERNAHAWAEVWVGDHWVTIDPTPAAERQEQRDALADRSLFSSMGAALVGFWSGAINDMSPDRQRAFLEPMFDVASSMMTRLREEGLTAALREACTRINPSLGGAVATGLVAAILIAAAMLVYRGSWRRLLKWLRQGPGKTDRAGVLEQTAASRMTRIYLQFREYCQQAGIPVSGANTALQNAHAAELQLLDRLRDASLEGMPRRLAEAYHRMRFGNAIPDDSEFQQLQQDLQRFRELTLAVGPEEV